MGRHKQLHPKRSTSASDTVDEPNAVNLIDSDNDDEGTEPDTSMRELPIMTLWSIDYAHTSYNYFESKPLIDNTFSSNSSAISDDFTRSSSTSSNSLTALNCNSITLGYFISDVPLDENHVDIQTLSTLYLCHEKNTSKSRFTITDRLTFHCTVNVKWLYQVKEQSEYILTPIIIHESSNYFVGIKIAIYEDVINSNIYQSIDILNIFRNTIPELVNTSSDTTEFDSNYLLDEISKNTNNFMERFCENDLEELESFLKSAGLQTILRKYQVIGVKWIITTLTSTTSVDKIDGWIEIHIPRFELSDKTLSGLDIFSSSSSTSSDRENEYRVWLNLISGNILFQDLKPSSEESIDLPLKLSNSCILADRMGLGKLSSSSLDILLPA